MRIAIIGRTEILYDTAELLHDKGHEIAAIVTAKEAPEYKRTSDDFKALAEKYGAAFLHTAKIRDAQEMIAGLGDIDIAVSVNYSGIIPQDFIDNFPLGVLNAHAGDLPRYRGNACQAWAIINSEDKIGLCIHSMIGGELDNGDILARSYLPIDINTKVGTIWDWINAEVPVLFVAAIEALDKDPDFVLEVQSKDPKDALRCYPRKPEDGLIDWRADNETVLRLINACNKPYAGAFCDYEGAKLIIWDAELLEDDEVFVAVPGQVTAIGAGYIDVACGQGRDMSKLRIKEIECGDHSGAPDVLIKSIRSRLS